jgi:hypothetical protein
MSDELVPEWMQEAIDAGTAPTSRLSFTVTLDEMRVVTGDSGGGQSFTLLALTGSESESPLLYNAWFRFVMDDKYQPVQPKYDEVHRAVAATYPMSALAGMTHAIRIGPICICTYTKYDNGNAVVDVRNHA